MWWSFRFFRLSVAERTHSQVFRVLTFSTGTPLGKIAIFSLKTFGLQFCLKLSNRLILGSKSMWWSFRFLRLSVAAKNHNQVFRVLHFFPGPRLGKMAIFSQKLSVFNFVWNRLTDSYWGRNPCGEVSDSSGCLLLREPIVKFLGFWRSRQVRP